MGKTAHVSSNRMEKCRKTERSDSSHQTPWTTIVCSITNLNLMPSWPFPLSVGLPRACHLQMSLVWCCSVSWVVFCCIVHALSCECTCILQLFRAFSVVIYVPMMLTQCRASIGQVSLSQVKMQFLLIWCVQIGPPANIAGC
jgi:hypothetical protein